LIFRLQGVPKDNRLEKLFISAMVARIWAKLSHFVCEFWHNISCKLYRNNRRDSTSAAV